MQLLKPITAITVLLLVVASLLVAGCTSSTTSSPSPSDVYGTVNPTQATAVPTTDGVQVRVSATQATVPQQIGSYTPKAGYKYVAFNCTIKNIAAPRYYANPFDWQLRDTAGGVYEPATATYSSEINGLQGIQTMPGDIISGLVVFEVPQNAQLKSITFTGGLNNVILTI